MTPGAGDSGSFSTPPTAFPTFNPPTVTVSAGLTHDEAVRAEALKLAIMFSEARDRVDSAGVVHIAKRFERYIMKPEGVAT